MFVVGSIVFSVNFKIALGMIAGGANFGSLCSNDDVSAVAAFPNLDFALFNYLSHLNVLKKRTISFFVVLFDGGNKPEFSCKLGKTFFVGGLCKACIHVGPFIVFAFGGVSEVFGGVTDSVQLLEPQL